MRQSPAWPPPAEDRLVLRLRRRADGAQVMLKAIPANQEDLAEEFCTPKKLFPLLPGQVPEGLDC